MGKIKCVKSSTLADILGLTCKKKRRATLQFLNKKKCFNRKIIVVKHMQVTNPELWGKLCRGGHRIRGHSRWWFGLGRAVRARGGSAGEKWHHTSENHLLGAVFSFLGGVSFYVSIRIRICSDRRLNDLKKNRDICWDWPFFFLRLRKKFVKCIFFIFQIPSDGSGHAQCPQGVV